MAMDNGNGNGGGNTSVYWEVNGPRRDGRRPMLANAVPVASIGRQAIDPTTGADVEVADAVALRDVGRHVNRGEVKIRDTGVEGHTSTDFDRIGRSTPPQPDDHPGMFRVRLRFRDADLAKLPATDREWIQQRARRVPELDARSWFLFIDVPAIHRNQPADGEPWPSMPWEIHWEW